MAIYSYTTSLVEEDGLAYIVAQANASLSKDQIMYTNASYVQARMQEILQSYIRIQTVAQEMDVAAAFNTASVTIQDAVLTQLGLSKI